ncbi:MAG: response regulator [Alphaproteobacteria bacterium]|nr:MAG: response regulator [Alphaproteobacteria bacterium]
MRSLKKILCIDDEDDMRAVIRFSLENVGNYVVTTCDGGMRALAEIEEINPDMILLDVLMPEMDGFETLKKIREIPRMREVPVLFLTAKIKPDEVEYYHTLGVSGVIPKPLDPMVLPRIIESEWRAYHEQE